MAANPLKRHLKQASRGAVIDAVSRLKSHIVQQRWIGPNNIYAQSYKTNRYREVLTRRSALRARQIRDYVAASVFTHCGDGWSLLGRALSAHIKGDASSAIHLAYYGELRAAMSLLAAEGIGVFSNRHIILSDTTVDITPDLQRIRGLSAQQRGLSRTHRFVWMALEHWADRKLSAELLAEVITPGSISLQDWFTAFGVSTNLHPIGRSWLKTWGIDIKQFGDDQILRNHSSYRPTRIIPKNNIPATDSLFYLKELWRMCEPNPTSRFDEIDKYLLRMSLAQAYQAVHGSSPREARIRPAYRAWVESNIANVGLPTGLENVWVDFLTWRTQPDDPKLIEEAGKVTTSDDPNHHVQVLARALLLLRLATGVNSRLLKSSGFTKSDLEFWWESYATDHGLTEDASTISDFLDLWTDVSVALKDISDWEATLATPHTYSDVVRHVSMPILRLNECERIALWGLAI